VITPGNEGVITVADAMSFAVEDASTKAIAVFAESIREPEVFLAAVACAHELGKSVTVLKAGRSELAARAAESHTGALVGDDRLVDAVLRQHGVIRARGFEELLHTANLAAATGRLRAPGEGVVSISSGACDVFADLAETEGVRLPQLGSVATATISASMPRLRDPLDVTAAALVNLAPPRPRWWWWRRAQHRSRPRIAVVPHGTDPGLPGIVDKLADGARASHVPAVVVSTLEQALDADADRPIRASGLAYLPSTGTGGARRCQTDLVVTVGSPVNALWPCAGGTPWARASCPSGRRDTSSSRAVSPSFPRVW